MIKIKGNKGITLLILVATIVIAIILFATTMSIGGETIEYTKKVKFLSYMQAIQKNVDKIVDEGTYLQYGLSLTNEQKAKLETVLENDNDTFITDDSDSEYLRYFNKNSLNLQLELDNIEDEVIVNFATREVISLTGIKSEGKRYYTQYNLAGGQKLIQNENTLRNVSFGDVTININGLNATFSIANVGITNGTLSYSIDNKVTWNVITNYTSKGSTVTSANITQSGTYYFKLTDNVTKVEYIKPEGVVLRLTNEPKLKGTLGDLSPTYNYSDLGKSEDWAYATAEDSKIYVWVPRFAYLTSDTTNIEFLRGTSDVTTSGGNIDKTNWTVPSQFTVNEKELLGVWVEVNQAAKPGLDLIDILSGTIL